MSESLIVALEIGTSKICAVVGEMREDGNIMVTGLGQCASCGVRKGIIVDLEKVVTCTRTAIHDAEQSGSVDIRQAHLIVSGSHIQSIVNPGNVPVYDADAGISRDDIEQVMEIAKTINLSHDSILLHTIPQKFSVDNQDGVIKPEGMNGAKLSLNMLIVYGSRNLINNAVKTVHDAGVEVPDVAFSGLCSALAVLTPEQKECGVVLIDLGAGTTSYVVYAGGVIATVGVLGVGGDHVTNDLALGFNISLKRAETLKHHHGTLLLDSSTHFQTVTIPSEGGFSACSVAASDLHAVINARVDEMFTMIMNELDEKSIGLHQLGAGVVLTGGGARLKGIKSTAEHIFDMPCSIGKPRNFSGLSTANEGPEYASLLGMIRYAVMSGFLPSHAVSIGGFLKRWFGK